MVWSVLTEIFTVLVDLFMLHGQSEREKDIEILLLRQQLRIVERKQRRAYQLSRGEKLGLAVLTALLKAVTTGGHKRLREVMRLFQPETVIKWHRELARRKWACTQHASQQHRAPRRNFGSVDCPACAGESAVWRQEVGGGAAETGLSSCPPNGARCAQT